ncbi:RNA polymerase sigma factor [Streptomyces abikoensis]
MPPAGRSAACLPAPLTDPDALTALYQAERQPLIRFLLFSGASWTEAQDAVQEAFTQLCLPRAAPITSPRAWLRTVAWRVWLRHNVRCPEQPTEDPLQLQAAQTTHWETPLQAAEITEEQRRVLALLLGLPPQQRAAMAWHLDGFTTRDTAQALGTTEAAVRQNLCRARSTLKARLQLEHTKGDPGR